MEKAVRAQAAAEAYVKELARVLHQGVPRAAAAQPRGRGSGSGANVGGLERSRSVSKHGESMLAAHARAAALTALPRADLSSGSDSDSSEEEALKLSQVDMYRRAHERGRRPKSPSSAAQNCS